MTERRILLLSLHPRYADAILCGTKTIELRRRPVNARPGTPVILYATSPVMAIVGTARLQEVRALAPQAAWRQYRQSLGLTRPQFNAYLDGSQLAYLLLLSAAQALNEPMSLRDLRQEGVFQPPQSFRYIGPADPAPLLNLVTQPYNRPIARP